MDQNKIIKIQRMFRVHKLKKSLKSIKKFDLKNKKKEQFPVFAKMLLDKQLLRNCTLFLNYLEFVFNKKTNLNNRVFLTGFLINNFTEELLGKNKDRHPLDTAIKDRCKQLVFLIESEEHTFTDLKMLHNYLINFNHVFNHWKNTDKDRTIQNIIISYHNRRKHLDYVKKEKMNKDQQNNIISVLNNEIDALLKNIKKIDINFDINYLINNHENIVSNIKKGMDEMLHSVSKNFKIAYLENLIKNIKEGNFKIIFDLINETNERILSICPNQIKTSITNKIKSYNYIEILVINEWNQYLIHYLNFIIDTVIIFSSEKDDNENSGWKNNMLALTKDNFAQNLPVILLEINNKIDKIYLDLKKFI